MKILSLNCFGVPLISPSPGMRMKLIAETILELNPDMIFLQEVFLPRHKKIFSSILRRNYPFIYLPKDGILGLGGGLCFFSKIRIVEKRYHFFFKSGFWTDLTCLEKVARKGFMRIKVAGNHCDLNIFHTHLTCNYKRNFDDSNRQGKLLHQQLEELAAAINLIPQSEPILIVGDLNIPPDSRWFLDFLESVQAKDITVSQRPSIQGNYYVIPGLSAHTVHRRKVDYVLYRGKNNIYSDWQYAFENTEKFFSDHLGILANIHFEKGFSIDSSLSLSHN